MRFVTPRLGAALTLLAVMAGVAGCSSLESRKPAPAPEPILLPEPEPYSLASHYFVVGATQDVIGEARMTRTEHEDTFVDLARRFNLGYEELVRANPGVDPWLPGEGREILLPMQFLLPNAPREGIVINLASMRLFYFTPKNENGEQGVYTFPIGIGRVGFATPIGRTTVTRMAKNPSWRPGPRVRAEYRSEGVDLPAVVRPGPDNPLGSRALYLGWPSYLIHGTNKPAGIGLRSSAGCIRLFPEDVELLYELVKTGVRVTVVNQPFVFGLREGELQVQSFEVLEDDRRKRQPLPPQIQKMLQQRGQKLDLAELEAQAKVARGLVLPASTSATSDISMTQLIEQRLAQAPRVRNAVPIGATWSGESAP